ncbi:helix-turn-helix domain-containing protein [Bauldia litoralis]|uniref:Helix-turn-helix domain-containing protein n=1 Tax=Bauldia litoralis TaxID=665467 RepID=A0A1G6EK08_9HYPH|nr:helix-turn-helix transcriptional regulator [Bauldia litoralis]SDB57759.1 Helix-turn-helix domain-containing protein [Bauldia litoralis]
MAFGPWIRSRREEAGISLKEFSRSIDISPAYWSRIERGLELAPKNSLIIAACERLGLATDRAFIEAARLPPDMQGDLELAISVYREFKSRRRT